LPIYGIHLPKLLIVKVPDIILNLIVKRIL